MPENTIMDFIGAVDTVSVMAKQCFPVMPEKEPRATLDFLWGDTVTAAIQNQHSLQN